MISKINSANFTHWKSQLRAHMRFKGLDLNLLAALDVLLECRSTTETARRLNLSQPTISSALGRLRDYFGDDLLVNVGREMVPTPLAEELGPAIAELLNIARFRIVHAEAFDPRTSRRKFRVLASDYLFDVLLANALARAAQVAPHITFEIGNIGPQGTRSFERGDIDLMITVPKFMLAGYPSEELFADCDVVVCWSGGRYAQGVDEAAFAQAEFAMALFGEARRTALSDMHFAEAGLALNAAVHVPSFSALPGAVCGTDRLAVMHRRHALFFQRLYPLVVHPLPVPGAHISEMAQWHPLRRKDAGLSWLLELLRGEVANIQEG
ncbi:LysR family transcriptional regulator [Alteraurantiacibacter buctensis]|uniref:LysR family transcriptional regulator n=1 Tax=Alteraurantiacibacter buctensis TaxID=1503981 RepID=A0A844YT64_9SPHN|nr:LysR family transcriptional regulator [Alteraurantiacibacter buctensis]MXO70061.1 LysR family transcriptional regulator [Alteraurantiacibacter buctensis]